MSSPRQTLHAILAALLGSAVLAACGDTLVDHRNTAVQQSADQCRDTEALCGPTNTCVPQGTLPGQVCGHLCNPCNASPAHASPVCLPTAPHDYTCDFQCDAGYLKTATGCSAPALVAAGGQFSCATAADGGEVHCWGANDQGQLGPGASGLSRSTSGKVQFAALVNVTALAAGPAHACAVVGATVYCWGDATGFGGSTSSATPVDVPALSGVVTLAAAAKHTCGITGAGALKCTGSALEGGGSPSLGGTVLEVAAGDKFSCALVSGAPPTVKCWGDDFYGQLGDGVSGAASASPVTVSGVPSTIQHVAAGTRHACASNDQSTPTGLYCWGDNSAFQLGTFATTILPPTGNTRVNKVISAIAAGGLSSCAVEQDPNDLLSCWAQDDFSAGGPAPDGEPNQIGFGDLTVKIAVGGAHTCFIESGTTLPDATHRLRCFGHDEQGQLGDGDPLASNISPVLVVDK